MTRLREGYGIEYPKGKIKRVFLEYEDGTMELTGEDAERWKKMADGQAVMAHVHGSRWPELNWKVCLEEEDEDTG